MDVIKQARFDVLVVYQSASVTIRGSGLAPTRVTLDSRIPQPVQLARRQIAYRRRHHARLIVVVVVCGRQKRERKKVTPKQGQLVPARSEVEDGGLTPGRRRKLIERSASRRSIHVHLEPKVRHEREWVR